MPFVDAKGMAPATGLTSFVEDMAKFVSAQFRRGMMGGAQLLSMGSLLEMHRVRMLETTWTQGYAVGFSVLREKDKLYAGHGGSYPGYMTQTYFRPDDKIGVIVLTNAPDAGPAEIAMRLMSSVGEAVAKASAVPPSTVRWDPSWNRFAGIYRSRAWDTQVVELNQRLVVLTLGGPSLENPLKLTPLGGGRFRLDGPTGGAAVGEPVRFVESDGRVTRMTTGDSFADRVPQ